MQLLRNYFELKQLEESQERRVNQLLANQQFQELSQKATPACLRSNSFIAIVAFVELYGYNPFEEQYDRVESINKLEELQQLKYETMIQSCIDIDYQLLQQFQGQQRFGTIDEDEEEDEDQDSFGFDYSKGLQIQQELQQLKQQTGKKKQSVRYSHPRTQQFPSYKQQYIHSSTKKSQKGTNKKEQSDEHNDYKLDFDFEETLYQPPKQETELYHEDDNQGFEESLPMEEQLPQEEEEGEAVPQFGNCDSQTFQKQLKQELDYYQNELRISLSNKDKQAELKQSQSNPLLFSSEQRQKIRTYVNQLKKSPQRSNLYSSDPFNNIQIKAPQQSKEATSESKKTDQSPVRQKPRKKLEPQQTSLLGSLFTPSVLKQMSVLNDDIIPQEELSIPVQYKEITVEKAFQDFSHEKPEDSVGAQKKDLFYSSYSPLKIQIVDEIQQIFSEHQKRLDKQFSEIRANSINLSYQQLNVRMPQIFDFMVMIAKELQGKPVLTKQMIQKVNEQYKDLEPVLLKKNPLIVPKIDQNQLAIEVYSSLSDFLSPQYFQYQFKLEDYKDNKYLIPIFGPLNVAIAITEADYPFVNGKIPPLTVRLIEQLMKSQLAMKLKQVPRKLLSVKISHKLYKEFQEQFSNLEQLVNSSESQIIQKIVPFVQLIRLSYGIDQCFQYMDSLIYTGDYKLQINDNKKYEENWKKIGTRYTSKKNKDDVAQQVNKELFDKFGVDFQAWQLNLKLQENELKKIKRIENDLMWKERRLEKQQIALQQQKENQEQLLENELQSKLNRELKEKQKKKKELEFRERQKEKVQSYKMQKQVTRNEDEEIRTSESQLIRQSSELTLSNLKKAKQEKKQQNQSRQEKLLQARMEKLTQLQAETKSVEEERIWMKAQQLLTKQRELLDWKQQILKQMQSNT